MMAWSFSMRTAVLVLGVYELAASLVGTVAGFAFMHIYPHAKNYGEAEVVVIVSCINFFKNVVLVFGSFKHMPHLVLPWLVFDGLFWVLLLFAITMMPVTVFVGFGVYGKIFLVHWAFKFFGYMINLRYFFELKNASVR